MVMRILLRLQQVHGLSMRGLHREAQSIPTAEYIAVLLSLQNAEARRLFTKIGDPLQGRMTDGPSSEGWRFFPLPHH